MTSKETQRISTVSKHHTLPAALIGAFSLEPAERSRESTVWVARRKGEPFRQQAENVSRRLGFYTIRSDALYVDGDETPSEIIDELWTGAETALPKIIASLDVAAATGVMDARQWLLAADFLAQLFVRNPGYDKRQYEGLRGVTQLSRDEINGSRTMNLQRIRPAVMFARWTVLVAPEGSFVTNDCSYMPVHDIHTDDLGYVFPFRHNLAVRVMAGPEDKAFVKNGDWFGLELPRDELAADQAASFNLSMAANALDEIYGPTEAVVGGARAGFAADVELIGPDFIVPSSAFLREHELDFYELLDKFGMDTPQGSFMWLPTNPA